MKNYCCITCLTLSQSANLYKWSLLSLNVHFQTRQAAVRVSPSVMDYRTKMTRYLFNCCNFLGFYTLDDLKTNNDLTFRIKHGGRYASATVIFQINSPYLSEPYYALLYREGTWRIEWFDPLGNAMPAIVSEWIKNNGYINPDQMSAPLLSPDNISWSGEFCAYFMKWRKWCDSMDQTRWRFFESRLSSCISRVLNDVDFTISAE